ncbi:flavin reductase family protein [Streptomyces sp. NPDC003697]
MTVMTDTPQGSMPQVDGMTFREAMTRFPSGITIVTTVDPEGRPHGFTASAFSSVSADPPLVLTCLDKGARCHDVFLETPRFAVAILRADHWDIARRFASKVDDKFDGRFTTDRYGLSQLPDALAYLACETDQRISAGDHTILLGRVVSVTLGEGEPAVFYSRALRHLRDLDETAGV